MKSVKLNKLFSGQHDDELAFNVGDIITLISKEEEAWWKGELDGKQGVFPSNYVEEIPSNCKFLLGIESNEYSIRGDFTNSR